MKHFMLFGMLLMQWLPLSAQFLQKGDTIAIISPSSATDTATINGGIRTLQAWGFHTLIGPHALFNYHGFAGTAAERKSDLMWALRHPHVKAVMCSRGGDGAVQLLTGLPLDTLRSYPKLLIGFSDVTALLCAEARAGNLSIHGSMCHAISTFQGTDTVSQALCRMMTGDIPVYHTAGHSLDIRGRAQGVLVGGNMSVFHGLAGSDYDPLLLPEIVLFIEDTGEGMTKVDRMLHNIEVRGLLPHVKGVIVGQFTNYKHPENGFADMYQMLHSYLSQYGIPVCFDFPVGHVRMKNFPMLVGSTVLLEVCEEGTTLTFAPRPSY